ncbi:hypothetical protein RN001_010482 [Aquatica leii]|uniref:ATP-binding cassette sub-family B member 6 n=1 Tax=Aquatica leii TaxID=1421715 RepID=A0AAN7P9N4_9COLE|nr:hypothetical protein RN001_010482 [Aquatica leii]
MYKTRGKPDDVLNRAAAQQEKDLAAAIHINPIRKPEVVPKLDLHGRGSSDVKCLKNQSRRVIPPKKVSNKIPGRLQKVSLGLSQKPSVATKSVNSNKPIWESSKLSVPVYDNRYSLQKQLEEVSMELNIGNAQLQQVKKLLDKTTRGERSKKFLYGVNKDVDEKPRKNEYNSDVLGKKRFLLTLNNVQQRMQKMQSKFFNSNGSRYKSVKDVMVEATDRDNIDAEADIVFNKNEKDIMDSAKKALARRKTLFDDDVEIGSEDPGKKFQSALSNSIMKSSYLKKEFKNTDNLDLDRSNSHSIDDSLFGKLQQSFTNRPFAKTKSRDHKESVSTWSNIWNKFGVIAPHFWPKDSILQVYAVICLVLLILGRINNLYVPIFNKLVVDSLSMSPLVLRVDLIVTYIVLKAMQGGGTDGMGILNNARAMLWVRVQQYTSRNIRVALLSHLHSLSLRWHLQRKTGEVLRLMDRGTDSIKDLVNYIVFTIMPTVVDILVAIGYFIITFNLLFGVIIGLTMLMYLAVTIAVTEYRTKHKRRMNVSDNATRAQSVDSLLNFETVKYYSGENFEVNAYEDAIIKYQQHEFKVNVTLNGLRTLQNVIISSGLLIGSIFCAYLVVEDHLLTVGDYILFSTYHYVVIQNAFVDMENMLDLLHEQVEIANKPNANSLEIAQAHIVFKNVSFSYDKQPILKNVCFEVPPFKTLALVGSSGSGKSTIVRLLFRFYDVNDGSILIDGQNVNEVTYESLRKSIGVVPQDTVLFNSTIKHNIKYGRLDASEIEVIEAARQVDIHERILKMRNGYDTKVGERGLMLSGGEKQRVAIARTLLKSPAIIVLDEATSALDVHTERHIQNALNYACEKRTTIIVAHRLSTVIHADEILVLQNGEVIERGTHNDLLELNGVYASMWQQQVKEE